MKNIKSLFYRICLFLDCGFERSCFLVIAMAMVMSSCGPGRWVGGNAKHFQQRHDAKQKNQQTLVRF